MSGKQVDARQRARDVAIFNRAIEQETDPDRIAKLELCREYFTNPTFKAALEEFTFALNQERR